MRRTAKYTWQGSLSDHKFTQLYRKFKITAIYGYTRPANGQRQTGTLSNEISTMWKRRQGRP